MGLVYDHPILGFCINKEEMKGLWCTGSRWWQYSVIPHQDENNWYQYERMLDGGSGYGLWGVIEVRIVKRK